MLTLFAKSDRWHNFAAYMQAAQVRVAIITGWRIRWTSRAIPWMLIWYMAWQANTLQRTLRCAYRWLCL